MLRIQHLRKEFTGQDAVVNAVDDVSFQLSSGMMAAVVGKSGSGKSTLLALLGALDAPTSGSIEVDGKNIATLRGKALLAYRRTTIGFVFQNYNLIPNLSALENVTLPMEFSGVKARERRGRAEQVLSQVGITGAKLKRMPGKLSGGEQQRIAIARALANKPKLILADEPTGNLDSATGQKIIDLLRSLAKSENTTIITVTHDQAIASHADRVFRLVDGKLS